MTHYASLKLRKVIVCSVPYLNHHRLSVKECQDYIYRYTVYICVALVCESHELSWLTFSKTISNFFLRKPSLTLELHL